MLAGATDTRIDRMALVRRHNVIRTALDRKSPMQVGNGEFAFGMDITGLQTFVPFNTMSQWGWNSFAPPIGQTRKDFQGQVWDTHGRQVRYPAPDPLHPELSTWMAGNPHRINLGRLGLILKKSDGSIASADDLKHPNQHLDLWTGTVTSKFELEGQKVVVTTLAHPTSDSIAVEVISPLVAKGQLAAFLECPDDDGRQFADYVGSSTHPVPLQIVGNHPGRMDAYRALGNNSYHVSLAWQGDATFHAAPKSKALPLRIVKAEFGAKDRWMEVTDVVEKYVQNGTLAISGGNWMGPDPYLGQTKTLRVKYLLDGKPGYTEAQEGEELLINIATDRNRLYLQPGTKSDRLAFVCAYSTKPLPASLPTFKSTIIACQKQWPAYWKSGGAIDLSGSKDPRWKELERRIVLSQYLMKVNEAGSLPPQESGLVNNGWFGRFHMEMNWWHAAHWAVWNRWNELDRNLVIYKNLLPMATKTAHDEGYSGARWPKCIGPDFLEWPHEIHSFLIWQQPHPIFFAELDYRAHPTQATLKKWLPVVEASADFMASYAFWDPATKRYVLGPPLFVASENTDPKTTMNPTFELGYWRFGLRTAQTWHKRLGLAPKPEWSKVLKGLSPLPQQEGLYVLHEGVKDMWTKWTFEHPALTAVLGMLPGDGVDRAVMRRTFDRVVATWDFNHTWGWDFPMLAMCAAKVGEPERAVELLLHPSAGFQFDSMGLATGGPYPYFPANGGLLYAIALMSEGWDGSVGRAPGFPKNGMWKVRYEGLAKAP